MAHDDYAIVVGIQSYPELGDLEAPDRDARDFRDWLIDPAAGNVPEEQTRLIVTSLWEREMPFASSRDAKPIARHILDAADDLLDMGLDNPTGRIGRRLYLYFAGHGCERKEGEAALLMADATQKRIGPPYHWLGQYTAEFFRQAGYFDEILLFMDCCREPSYPKAINEAWGEASGPDFAERVKRFYAFATRWSLPARERPMDGGTVRGVFTTVLLEGLREGHAYQPNSGGQITTKSLEQFLIAKMRELNEETAPQESDFRADSFIITQVAPVPRYPVTVHLPAHTAGMKVEIEARTPLRVEDDTVAAPPTWETTLEKGYYVARIPEASLQAEFEVAGTGGKDVRF